MKQKTRKGDYGAQRHFVARLEKFARHLVELADEEARLVETIADVRRVKARMVAELANAAKAEKS